MAKNNTTQHSAQSRATVGNKLVCCLDCLHAMLHRYGTNPILAACQCKPQYNNERFPYQVEVASPVRRCSDWDLDPQNKEVEQRKKVA